MKRLSTIVLGVLLLTLFSPFLTSTPLGIEKAAAQSQYPSPSQGATGKIAFVSPTDYQIYTMNADGTGITRLTNSIGYNFYPAWSPDRTKIAFSSGRDDHWQIYVMTASGAGQTRLITSNSSSDLMPAWSPDGKSIAFYSDRDGNPEIYTVKVDGTDLTRITNNLANDWRPTWSPDGTQLAFVSSSDGTSGIYKVNTNGTGLTKIATTTATDLYPAWSPDGTRIAFVSGGQIYTVGPDGTGQTKLTNDSSNWDSPTWSPDGKQIAASSYRSDGTGGIYTIEVSNGKLTLIGPGYVPAWASSTPVSPILTATPLPTLSVKGRLKDGMTMIDLKAAGIYVKLYRQNGSQWDFVSYTTTDADGKYSFQNLASSGVYQVRCQDNTGRYVEWMGPKTVSVPSVGDTNPALQNKLQKGIYGQISTSSNGLPLISKNLIVKVVDKNGVLIGSQQVKTDEAGFYAVSGLNLPDGDYQVDVVDTSGAYKDSVYNKVTITSGVAKFDVALSKKPIQGITGKVIGFNTKIPVSGIQVRVYRKNPFGNWDYYSNGDNFSVYYGAEYRQPGKNYNLATTDSKGEFALVLESGTYRVGFFDPSAPRGYGDGYYTAQNADQNGFTRSIGDFGISTEVTVSASQESSVKVALDLPTQPVAEVVTSRGSVTTKADGTLQINVFRDHPDLTIKTQVTCPSGVKPTNVILAMQTVASPYYLGSGRPYPMTESPLGSGIYQATIPGNDLHGYIQGAGSETSDLKTTWSCGSTPGQKVIGQYTYLYDPSGYITDAVTGKPIAGAVVSLYKVPGWEPKSGVNDTRPNTCESHLSKAADAKWSQPAPVGEGRMVNPDIDRINGTVEISPSINPQVTGADGYYGWDVAKGCWYIEVRAEGYQAQVSPVVGVPPEVKDLHMALTPLPKVDFSKSVYTVNESEGIAEISIRLSNPFPEPVQVDYATAGGSATGDDYTTIPTTTFYIAPGETSSKINVFIKKDTLDDKNETVKLTLANPKNADLGANASTILIIDPEAIPIENTDNPSNPWYANGRIEVSPYPVKQGQETTLSAIVDNPTSTAQKFDVEFYVSGLGVGQWWTKVETLQGVEIAANGSVTKSVKWFPATEGHYCVRVKIIGPNDTRWLQRNLDIQKAEPGKCVLRDFQVCNPYTDTRTFTINTTKQEGLAGCSASVAVKQVTLAPKACTTTQVSICVPQVACGSGKCAYRVEPNPGNDGVLFEVEVGGGICEVTPSATPTATADVPITPSLTPTATAKPITDTPSATNTPTNTPTGTAKPITNTPTPTNTSTSGGTVTDGPNCKAEQVEMVGIGLKGKTEGILNIPAVPWAELQEGGALAKTLPIPSAVSFGSERLTTVTAKDQWNYGYLFQTKQTNVAGPVTVKVEEVGTNQTARAAVAYFPKATSEKFVSAYNTTYEFVWGGTNGTWVIVQKAPLIVNLPKPLTKATNLTLKVAYMDNDNDNRPLTFKAEAGGVTQEVSATSSNIGELLNIETVTLVNVPAGTSEVKVTLLSPASTADAAGNIWPETGAKTQKGDSGMLLGATVAYPCQQQIVYPVQCKAEIADVKADGLAEGVNGTHTIPASDWSKVQLGGAGFRKNPPTSATFNFSSGAITAQPSQILNSAPSIQPSEMMGYSIETNGKAGDFTVLVNEADASKTTAEALAIYYGKGVEGMWSSTYSTTLKYAWGGENEPAPPARRWAVGPATLDLQLPIPLQATMDVKVKAVVMDKNTQTATDKRIVNVSASAGGATSDVITLKNPDSQNINVVELKIKNVPAGTQKVKVTLESPINRGAQMGVEGAGDSVFLLGATAWNECRPVATTIPTDTATPTATPTEQGLIVHYSFDRPVQEGKLLDDSKTRNDARAVGNPQYVAEGHIGGAYSFGWGNYFAVGQNPTAGLAAFTVALWFKTADPLENYKLASAATWNGGPGSGWVIGTHYPELWSEDGASIKLDGCDFGSLRLFKANEWNHVVLTYDSSKLKSYINGQLVRDCRNSGKPLGNGAQLTIGYWMGFPFVGLMDDFRIYNRAISAEEVGQLENFAPLKPGITADPAVKTTEPVKSEVTVAPEVKVTEPVKSEVTVAPEVKTTEPVKSEVTVAPEVKTTEPVKSEATVAPEVKTTEPVKSEVTVAPEVKTTEPVKSEVTVEATFTPTDTATPTATPTIHGSPTREELGITDTATPTATVIPTATATATPTATAVTVSAEEGGKLTGGCDKSKVEVDLPAGAVEKKTKVSFTKTEAPAKSDLACGCDAFASFLLSALDSDGTSVLVLKKTITIKITFEVTVVKANKKVKLYAWKHGKAKGAMLAHADEVGTWEEVPTQSVDLTKGELTAETDQFTRFALVQVDETTTAQPAQNTVYLPLIVR